MKNEELNKKIGKNLKFYRLFKGFTQRQLAKSLNLTFQQIQKYEKGTDRLSLPKLFDICEVLNIDIHQFIDGVKNADIMLDVLKN